MYSNTVSQRYSAAFAVMKKNFAKIWGLSLLAMVINILISGLGSAVPIISLPICLAISASMSAVYLRAIRGEDDYGSADLFAAFKDFATAKRVICGMLWMMLWVLIWSLIPVAGFVFAIIKALEYSFTPYILMTRPELGPMEALNESKRLTKGLKGRMFGAWIIPVAIVFGAAIVLGVFSIIPFIGILFGLLLFCLYVATILFLPLLLGLLLAGFYEGAVNPPPPPQFNGQFQPQYQPYPQYGQPNPQYQQPYPQQQYYQPAPQQGQYYQPAPQPFPEQQVPPTAPAEPAQATAPAVEDLASTSAVTPPEPAPAPAPQADDFAPTVAVTPEPAPIPEDPETDKTVQIEAPVDLPEFPKD